MFCLAAVGLARAVYPFSPTMTMTISLEPVVVLFLSPPTAGSHPDGLQELEPPWQGSMDEAASKAPLRSPPEPAALGHTPYPDQGLPKWYCGRAIAGSYLS